MQRAERAVILWGAVVAALFAVFAVPLIISNIDSVSLPGEFAICVVLFLLGSVAGLDSLLAAWCVLANQAVRLRVPLATGLFLVVNGLFLLGGRFVNQLNSFQEMAIWCEFNLLLFLVVQVPLWLVRVRVRRRIGLCFEQHAKGGDRKFSIRYLLVSTGAAGVFMGLCRLVIPPGELASNYLLPASIWGCMAALIVFFASICLPCLWLVLSLRQAHVSTAAVALFLFWVSGPIVLRLTAIALLDLPLTAEGFLPPFYALGAGAIVVMLAGLLLLRLLGYRLMIADLHGTLSVEADESQSKPSLSGETGGPRGENCTRL